MIICLTASENGWPNRRTQEMTVNPLSGTMRPVHSGIPRGLPCTQEVHREEREIVYRHRQCLGHLYPDNRRVRPLLAPKVSTNLSRQP